MKATMNISIDPETKDRLKLYAQQNRKTVSQAITDWIWAQPVKESADGDNTEVEEK